MEPTDEITLDQMFADVVTFMNAAGQTIDVNNPDQVALYSKLVEEEEKETCVAASGAATFENFVETLDGLCDTAWVRIGRFVSMGLDYTDVVTGNDPTISEFFDFLHMARSHCVVMDWDFSGAWREVARSNLAKIDPETGVCIKRADGKILKPADWTPPDLTPYVHSFKNAK